MNNVGMTIAAQAMDGLMLKHEVAANNLANATTIGYKSDTLIFESFPATFEKERERISGGVSVADTVTKFEQGSLMTTNNPLDVAIAGEGFFVVQTPEGERYTREGSFSLDASGQLVTQDGQTVMGEGGPITITGADVSINSAGDIIVDGSVANRLRVVSFESPTALRKAGNNLFAVRDEAVGPQEKPADTRLVGSTLEMSSVSVVKEMVQMMQTMRAFTMNQNVMQAFDDSLKRAISEVGSVK